MRACLSAKAFSVNEAGDWYLIRMSRSNVFAEWAELLRNQPKVNFPSRAVQNKRFLSAQEVTF
ncbi:uncharacterized protein PHALS_03162 [Plasmopara halstedii]|uniref:Uncharacterized protein n=1 Tax=Plasmopara halstedii TaxID=4781 RepID=A0A0P1A7L1_PLAHL|nr:uncharacterized protein PHALS_03162 [Plasmopara halstedii]CEG36618.1 hypothetical protein PHALS_03162 [Plasmopara halstedii]|eukprot:XP_024572987.1 hypothetical protein PHALS_03162 [Plasmopara halstedii]